MSSEPDLNPKAETVIAKMQVYLGDNYLIHHIDEPINRAALRFRYHAVDQVSCKRFRAVLARFVAYLYGHGLPFPVRLSCSQACDEALALLGECYTLSPADGYAAALLDARQGQPPGMEVVLGRMAETINLRARRSHVIWVVSSFLDPSDWQLRCEIADCLLERYRAWLPEHMASCSGQQFADEILTLLMHCRNVDAELQQAYSLGF